MSEPTNLTAPKKSSIAERERNIISQQPKKLKFEDSLMKDKEVTSVEKKKEKEVTSVEKKPSKQP